MEALKLIGIPLGITSEEKITTVEDNLYDDSYEEDETVLLKKPFFSKPRFFKFAYPAFSNFLKAFALEVGVLTRIALPIIIGNIGFAVITATNSAFVGQACDKTHLAAAAIANSFAAIALFFAIGVTTALDTLVTQAATDPSLKDQMMNYLWRTLVLLTLLAVPVTVAYWYSYYIFRLMQIEENIAELAALFLKWSMPGIWPNFIARGLTRYLNNQNILAVPSLIVVLCTALNAALNVIFTLGVGMQTPLGYTGPAVATNICYWVMFVMMVFVALYYSITQQHVQYCCAKDLISPKGMYTFLSLAIPGCFMMVLEVLAFEVSAVIAAKLGEDALAAHAVGVNIEFVIFMVPLGISMAASIRVGNQIGAGKVQRAKFTSLVVIFMALATAAVQVPIVYFGKVATIFTNEEAVLVQFDKFVAIFAGYQVLDYTQLGLSGTLRGLGYHKIGAVVNFVSYYVIAIPLALLLVLKLGVGLVGLWMSLAFGIFMLFTLYSSSFLFVKWQKTETAKEGDESINA